MHFRSPQMIIPICGFTLFSCTGTTQFTHCIDDCKESKYKASFVLNQSDSLSNLIELNSNRKRLGFLSNNDTINFFSDSKIILIDLPSCDKINSYKLELIENHRNIFNITSDTENDSIYIENQQPLMLNNNHTVNSILLKNSSLCKTSGIIAGVSFFSSIFIVGPKLVKSNSPMGPDIIGIFGGFFVGGALGIVLFPIISGPPCLYKYLEYQYNTPKDTTKLKWSPQAP